MQLFEAQIQQEGRVGGETSRDVIEDSFVESLDGVEEEKEEEEEEKEVDRGVWKKLEAKKLYLKYVSLCGKDEP